MNCRAVFVSLALLFPSAALAQDYVLGTDGYYYSGGRAYTRVAVSNGYYNYCGRYCYAPTYQYTLVPQPVAVTTTTTTNNYPPANWRTEVIKAHEAKAEAIAYEAALQTLTGFTGYGYGNTLQLSTQGVNGQTVYGYNSIASLYGDTSISTLFQQANRLAETQQQLSGEAVGQFNSLVDAHGDRLARSAEIIAKGQVMSAILNPPSATKSQLTITPTQPQQAQQVEPVQQPVTVKPIDSTAAWVQSAQKCLSCHGNGKKEGGFDVTTYPSMTQEQRLGVISRLTSKDDKMRMPRNQDKTPGPRLGANEIRAWLNVGS